MTCTFFACVNRALARLEQVIGLNAAIMPQEHNAVAISGYDTPSLIV